MNVLTLIKENYQNFTKSETVVADYFLSDCKTALNESVQSIAKITKTSTSTVMRFVRKIGFDGLAQLRYAIASAADEEKDYGSNIIIEKNDSIKDIILKEKRIIEKCAEATFDIIRESDLKTAVKRLKEAETIYLFGVGASGFAAFDLYNKLIRLNKKCVFHAEENMQILSSVNVTEKDVVLAISYSGETRAVNIAAEFSKKKGAYCIAVTNADMSPLRTIADLSLTVKKTENEIRIGAICSRFAQLMICDVLFLCLALDDYDNVEKKLIESRKLSNKFNLKSEKIIGSH